MCGLIFIQSAVLFTGNCDFAVWLKHTQTARDKWDKRWKWKRNKTTTKLWATRNFRLPNHNDSFFYNWTFVCPFTFNVANSRLLREEALMHVTWYTFNYTLDSFSLCLYMPHIYQKYHFTLILMRSFRNSSTLAMPFLCVCVFFIHFSQQS